HNSNIDRVLHYYNTMRPPRANSVMEGSNRAGEIYDNYYPGKLNTSMVAERLKGQWEPVWYYDLQKEVESAFQSLYDEGVFKA
ncbi:hypothetical protein MPER_08146, partial [Moniliophthora perniciosa FA553]